MTTTHPRSTRTGAPSFSLQHRLLRAAWSVVWLVLASWTPPPLHTWRRFLLRLFGAQIDSTARIYGSARIWYPPNLAMGAHAVLGWRSFCYNQAKITLGDYAVVSQFAHLCAGTHDVDDPDNSLITKPILIGRFAWVAADAFVGPGVVVGEGAVLGARAVAFRNLEPWTIYIGNPLHRLRQRRPFEMSP